MIDAQSAPARRLAPADEADAVLRRLHPLVIRDREAVLPQLLGPRLRLLPLAELLVGRPLLVPVGDQLLAVLGAPDLVLGELARAIFLVLGIAFPVLVIGEGHSSYLQIRLSHSNGAAGRPRRRGAPPQWSRMQFSSVPKSYMTRVT